MTPCATPAHVLLLLAWGCDNGTIARALHLRLQTVKNYIGRWLRAAAVRNRTALAMWYWRQA